MIAAMRGALRVDGRRLLAAWAQSARSAARRWEFWALLAVLALALILRVWWVSYAAREPQGLHDPSLYYFYGHQISNGNGYTVPDLATAQQLAPELVRQALEKGSSLISNGQPTAYYPIGYPAALGGVYALVKHTPIPDNFVLANAYFNVFLGVATVGLLYGVGRRLFNVYVGLLAALWLAVFPNLIYHTSSFLTETLFNFLIMAALLVLLAPDWRERPLSRTRLAVFGVMLGLSALVRPISLLFLPLLLIVWLATGIGWRRSLAQTGVALAAGVAVIMPWSIRNFVVMDAPVFISTNLGDDLCIGHHPGASGHFEFGDYCFNDAKYEGLDRKTFEVRRNNDDTRLAVKFAVHHPGAELKLLSRKAWYTWWQHDWDGLWAAESYGDDVFMDPNTRQNLRDIATGFFHVSIVIGGLGLLGFVLSPRDPRRIFFLLALLAFAGVPLVFFGDARFHVPAIPLLMVAAAWAVVYTAQLVPKLVVVQPPDAGERPSGAVEVAEGERPVAEQDALQDA